MKDKAKVLILGGSSFVGRHLFRRLGPERAIATYCHTPLEGGVYFDSLTMRLEEIIPDPAGISCAVILLGDTDPDSCCADRKKSRALNVESIKAILDYLKKWRIKPIFTSSEFVFDGKQGNYTEADPAKPILLYGEQKAQIEKYIQDNFCDFVIFRLAKVFGSTPGDGTLFSNWLGLLDKSDEITCAADQIFSPVYVDDVTRVIEMAIDKNIRGVFHLAGPRAFARIDLLRMLLTCAEKYGCRQIRVVPKSIHDFKLREKRPLNVSMRSDKLVRTLGLTLSDTEEICRSMVEEKFRNHK
jgi:dTDP-4-dehydrorhamnose reductase